MAQCPVALSDGSLFSDFEGTGGFPAMPEGAPEVRRKLAQAPASQAGRSTSTAAAKVNANSSEASGLKFGLSRIAPMYLQDWLQTASRRSGVRLRVPFSVWFSGLHFKRVTRKKKEKELETGRATLPAPVRHLLISRKPSALREELRAQVDLGCLFENLRYDGEGMGHFSGYLHFCPPNLCKHIST